jgi:hypothetical protein
VVAASGLACIAYWLHEVGSLDEQKQDVGSWRMVREGMVLSGVVVALLIMYGGRAVLPFR